MHTVKTVMFYTNTTPFSPRTPLSPYYFATFIFVTVLTITILLREGILGELSFIGVGEPQRRKKVKQRCWGKFTNVFIVSVCLSISWEAKKKELKDCNS